MKIIVLYEGIRIDLNLPMDDAALTFQMKRHGAREVSPVCRLGKAVDAAQLLKSLEGQEVNLDEINFLAWYMKSLTDYQIKVMGAYVYEHGIESVRDLINLAASLRGLSLIQDFSDRRDIGRQLYMDLHIGESTEKLDSIDFEAHMEEVLKNSYTDVTPYGVYVEQQFAMSQWYNGRTFPMYIYDSGKVAACLSIENAQGQCDYLYLPTNSCSLRKLVHRLGAEQFEGLTISSVDNMNLPEKVAVLAGSIQTVEELSYLNELCEKIVGHDDVAIARLSTAAEFVGAKRFQDYTYIADHMKEFEIWMNVHNDEEYGKLLVTDPAIFKVDPEVTPYIDYAALGAAMRTKEMAASGYIADGFVGAKRPVQEYLEYDGEYSSPLERDNRTYATLRLIGPLLGRIYHNDCDDDQEMDGADLCEYESYINEALKKEAHIFMHSRGLMHYFDGSLSVARKVMDATPTVQRRGGELCGVLECRIKEPLTERELGELKEYWIGQASDGWGEGFEQREIEVEDEILCVSFWSPAMEITAEMSSQEECQQDIQMNM